MMRKGVNVMFHIGDKAVYPGHGVGVIEAIETKRISGKEQSFFILRFVDNGMTIMVPEDNVESAGLRTVIRKIEVRKVIGILKDREGTLDNQTWNRRYREYMEKINKGSIYEIAEVLRDLHLLRLEKELSFGEKKIMDTWILCLFLFLICGASGYFLTKGISPRMGLWGFFGGLLLSALTLLMEDRLSRVSLKNLLGSFIGLILGIILANLISNIFSPFLFNEQQMALPVMGLLYGVCGYTGLRIGLKKGAELHLPGLNPMGKNLPRDGITKILNPIVIIDGRIADISETGFIEGPLLIPQFVLGELQHIADSSDPIKRTRGKRGLEILQHIQKQVNVDVRIVDTDYPSVKEVDAKLIELAKEASGKTT